jgi:uncharacterized phage infection (PIP) family protein YhgE
MKVVKKDGKFVVVLTDGKEDPLEYDGELFDQEKVNTLMADNKRTLQRENQSLKAKIAEMEKDWEELESTIKEVADEEGIDLEASGEEDDDDSDDSEIIDKTPNKAIKALERRYKKQIDALSKQLNELDTARKSEITKRREAQRDNNLNEALQNVGVVSLEGGRKWFSDKLFWDEDSEAWLYRTGDGLEMPIEKGVADELPDWLRAPVTSKGGSGSKPPKGAALVHAQVEQKRKELTTLQEKAKASGGDEGTVSLMIKSQRELKEMESSLKKPA